MEFAAIILAAGAGRRFGGGKMTAAFRGQPLVSHALAIADAAPVNEIIVVLGAECDEVADAVKTFHGRIPRRTVFAPDWQEGMAASLRAGVSALASECAGAFVFLGDMPDIPVAVLDALADALRAGAPAAAPTYRGQRGHPVLLGRAVLDRVSSLVGDHGARGLLDAASLVPVDDYGVVRDIDTPDDISAQSPCL